MLTVTLRFYLVGKIGETRAVPFTSIASVLFLLAILGLGWKFILAFLSGATLNALDVCFTILFVYGSLLVYEALTYRRNTTEKTPEPAAQIAAEPQISWDKIKDSFIFQQKVSYNSDALLQKNNDHLHETPDDVLLQQMREEEECEKQIKNLIGDDELQQMRELIEKPQAEEKNISDATQQNAGDLRWARKKALSKGIDEHLNNLF